ncbi:MAG: DUF5615 family PIN-like protein [Myxococcota bacterium]
MKLLCDLHISPITVEELRRAGHDVLRATDRLAPTAPDEALLALARAEERILVSQDQDFGALLAASGAARPSVINLRIPFPRIERINAALRATLTLAAEALTRGAVVVVEERRVRIRRLPIGREAD